VVIDLATVDPLILNPPISCRRCSGSIMLKAREAVTLRGWPRSIVGIAMHSRIAKAILALAALLAAAPTILACTGPAALEAKVRAHPDADTYADIGNWFGDRKQYDCALDAFRSALKLEPGSAKLYYLVGLTLYASGDLQDALEPLGRSIFLMPEVLKPHLLLASAHEQLHHPKEARAEWEAALRIDHLSPEALDGMSKSLMEEGDYASAIEALREAPQDETLTLDLALAYGKANMLDQASEVLTKALQKTPSSLPLTAALVTVLVRQVHYQEAVHLAEKSARLHPANVEAQRLYLRVMVLNGDSVQARPLARRLLTAHPHDFDFLYLSGILANQAGQYTEGRAHLEQAVAIDPNYYNAHYNLGVALLELKQFPEAREQFAKALELGGTEPEIRFKYATALRDLGETQLAQEQLKLYQQQLETNQKHALAASKMAQGDKEFESGDAQKAVADFREALDATPDDPQLSYKLALALDKTGDTAAETQALENAVKIDPGFALAHNQLGYLASRNGDSASAEEHFRLAVRAAPNYTQAWISLAATLGMESRFTEAQEALASALKIEPANTEALQLRKDLTAAQEQR
jgi:tetratricopeptide (TPR) repeat protein